MADIILFDLGGVILTNAWDHAERTAAAQEFGLDAAAFEVRHAPLAAAVERGEMSLAQYLDAAVFDHPRTFGRDAFIAYMQGCSQPLPDSLLVLKELAQHGRARLATLNNEGRDLNEFRIEHFGLKQYFSVFCSSCYLGARKPDADIFQRALGILQAKPQDCLFVDDREENLIAPRRLGVDSIRFTSPVQLRQELGARGLL
ncbi:MAG: HAD family hydrolase [Terriglobales bacterium]